MAEAAAAEPRQERRSPVVSIEVPQAEAEADAPPQKTFEEVFRQSGLAWQAYFAIFLTEFIIASTWATYCVITLYNVDEKTCEVKDEFWPIILLLCSMKFSGPWFESWSQNFIRNHTYDGATQAEPNKLTYRNTMNKHIFIKRQLTGWTLLSTFMMGLVWLGIGSVATLQYYVVESVLHIPLGLFASGTLMLFRCLCKHIYWNNFPEETYDGIAQTAKATCLIASSLGFMRATEFYYDLSSARTLIVFLLLNMIPTVYIICSGNHFAKPPSYIKWTTLVQSTLPPRSRTPTPSPSRLQQLPTTPQRPSPSLRMRSPITLPKFGKYEDCMTNQKYQRLQDFSSSSRHDETRTSIVVNADVHVSPDNKSERRLSPRRESPSRTRETRSGQDDINEIRSGNVESLSPTRSESKDRKVEEEEAKSSGSDNAGGSVAKPCSQLIEASGSGIVGRSTESLRPSLEGTGAIRKQTLQVHKSPGSPSRSSETKRSQQPDALQLPSASSTSPTRSAIENTSLGSPSNSNVREDNDITTKEEGEDLLGQISTVCTVIENPPLTRSPPPNLRHSVVTIDPNLQSETVRFERQGGRRRASIRSSSIPTQNKPDPVPATVTASNSSLRRSSRVISMIKRFFGIAAEDESGSSVPAMNFLPASPTIFKPVVVMQDKQYLSVIDDRERTKPKKLPGPRNPDPNQIYIDPGPEPRRLDTSAVHDPRDVDSKPNMVEDLADSVRFLLISLRRSFKDVWFWYTIVSTAMVNLISVMFLVACPQLALLHGAKNMIKAADTLTYIALPWLLVSIILSWPLQKLQKKEKNLFLFGLTVHILGLILTSIGIMARLLGYTTIYPWLVFGIGFGAIVNLTKTTNKFFCYCTDGLRINESGLSRNTDVGTGMALILFYFIYHICMNTGYLSIGLAYFMSTWAVCSIMAATVKSCTFQE